MKRKSAILLTMLGMMFVLNGCFKDPDACTSVTPANEDASMLTFTNSLGGSWTKHPTNMYYQILNPGTGATPTDLSKVFVAYTGKLLNGTVFDAQPNAGATGWQLGGLIDGWRIGLPLIKKGGKIRLVIPSAYGYGCKTQGSIPSNSVLYFEIDLIDVQ